VKRSLLKYILFLSLCLSLNNGHSSKKKVYQRVLLLTSVDAPQDYLDDLENNILRFFKHDEYILNAEHYANADRIHRALTSGLFTAIIYVSHGSYFNGGFLPIDQSKLYDLETRDISSLFKKVHPNLKYLGIVSCYGNKFVKSLRKSGKLTNKSIQIDSFDGLIDANKGVSKLTYKAYKRLNKKDIIDGYYNSCQKEQGFKIRLTPLEMPQEQKQSPIMVNLRGQLLGVIPPEEFGQTKEFFVNSNDIKSKVDLKVILSNGCQNCSKDATKFPLGKYQISLISENENQGKWELFAKRDGTPFGVSQNIYRYQGNVKTLSKENYQQYYCPRFYRVKKARRKRPYPYY
jgi:hypothetical protein